MASAAMNGAAAVGSAERRLRVLHLVLNVEAGGLEMVVLNLVRRSDRTRFEHRVLCLEGLGALEPGFRAAGTPLAGLRARSRLAALACLRAYVRHWLPDVLHTHNARPHHIGAAARVLGLVPALLHTKHGRNQPGIWRTRVWNHLASQASDVVIAVSADAAAVARDLERVPDRVLGVLHNGIELGPRRESSARAGGATAVCVARLQPVKDHATLLRAARLVVDRRPDFRLLLAGDGPERGRLEALAEQLRLADAASFLGHRADVRPLLESSDAFVLASRSEGLSLSILEAMAASLPVIATAVGGNPEVVVDGQTGFLVPPGSAEALAQAIERVIGTPGLGRQLGAAGRQRAEELFSLEAMVSRYEALYLELASRGRN